MVKRQSEDGGGQGSAKVGPAGNERSVDFILSGIGSRKARSKGVK